MYQVNTEPQWAAILQTRQTCKTAKDYTHAAKAAGVDTTRAARIGVARRTYGVCGRGLMAKLCARMFAQVRAKTQ